MNIRVAALAALASITAIGAVITLNHPARAQERDGRRRTVQSAGPLFVGAARSAQIGLLLPAVHDASVPIRVAFFGPGGVLLTVHKVSPVPDDGRPFFDVFYSVNVVETLKGSSLVIRQPNAREPVYTHPPDPAQKVFPVSVVVLPGVMADGLLLPAVSGAVHANGPDGPYAVMGIEPTPFIFMGIEPTPF